MPAPHGAPRSLALRRGHNLCVGTSDMARRTAAASTSSPFAPWVHRPASSMRRQALSADAMGLHC